LSVIEDLINDGLKYREENWEDNYYEEEDEMPKIGLGTYQSELIHDSFSSLSIGE